MSILTGSGLERVVLDVPMTCLDIGARRGFTTDLLPIAPAVDAVGFEPDESECRDLSAAAAADPGAWRSLRYLPFALGPENTEHTLRLYSQRGCSSLLEADVDLAARFSRADYYRLEDEVRLPTRSLDRVASENGLAGAAYLKIDVQGFELSVFETAIELLRDALLAIRTEVSFVPIYKGQPLFGEIASFLGRFGFVPLGFEELHHWRLTTKTKHPQLAAGPIPYSRGQMVHGDVLFVRDPDGLPNETPEQARRLVQEAMLLLAYGYVDHAYRILASANVARFLAPYKVDPERDLRRVSQNLFARHRRERWRRRLVEARSGVLRRARR